MSRWEELGLRWTESGRLDAPALVLSNSLGTTLDMWEPQMAVLGERYHVIRYDQRGHGGSVAPAGPYTLPLLADDVLALLDHIGVRRASFMGTSLGGMVGMWLAAHAPDRIEELTLCCTSAYPGSAGCWQEKAATVREHGTSEIVSMTVEGWFTPYFREHFALETAEYAAMIASTDDEAFAQCCEVISTVDLRADLSAITAPTLVLAGADDPVLPPEHAEAIAEGIGANARFQLVPHAAHLATVEQADHVNQLLTSGVTGPSR